MALFDIYLDLQPEYVQSIQDIYKFTVIFVVFQVLYHYSFPNKNVLQSALSGSPLNDEFATLVIFLMIGILAYHLVASRVIAFL